VKAKVVASLLNLLFAAYAAAESPPATGRYISQLEESDWILRSDALHYLAEHGVKSALAPIRSIAEDKSENPWIRGRALIALCKIQTQKNLPPLLLEFSSAPDSQQRAAAGEALEAYTGTAARALSLRLLSDTVPAVKYRAIATYASIDRAAAWTTIDQLTRAPDPPVLPLAARALAFTGTDEALARLVTLVDAPFKTHGQTGAIVRFLADIPEPKLIPLYLGMLEALEPENPVFPAIISAIGRHEHDDIVGSLSQILATSRESATFTAARVITLLIQAPELGEALRKALSNAKETETLQAGLTALGCKEMQPDLHQEFFSNFLQNPETDLRTLAIRCLSHCEKANLYEILTDIIDDEDKVVRYAALNALLLAPLDKAPTGKLVAYLESSLASTDEPTRSLGFKILAHAGNSEDFKPALTMLGDALKSTDDVRREAVATALGSIAPNNGIAPVARSQGYITDWMIVGTFYNDKEHKAFTEELPPEKNIDFNATYPSTYVWALRGHQNKPGEKPIEREVTWNEASVDRTNGKLRMGPLLPPPGTFSLAYAVADFNCTTAQEAFLSIDGDDAFKVWFNDKILAEEIAPYQHRQSCIASRSQIAIKLKPGINRLLVKSANIGHEWWVRLRLTDADGKPIEAHKQ
jgi:HEAT repeat protein